MGQWDCGGGKFNQQSTLLPVLPITPSFVLSNKIASRLSVFFLLIILSQVSAFSQLEKQLDTLLLKADSSFRSKQYDSSLVQYVDAP